MSITNPTDKGIAQNIRKWMKDLLAISCRSRGEKHAPMMRQRKAKLKARLASNARISVNAMIAGTESTRVAPLHLKIC